MGNLSEQLLLQDHAESAYLRYALAVVKDRALPQVQDGLKPVQRRILFAMRELGLAAPAKPVKSARVVGDVIGKYHPHGDSATYEALVRQAQNFSLRYPLVHGQGNFGTRDGDNAAAYRYTECRLSHIAELLLAELDQGTVDFAPNFDNTQNEPELLPARLPFLLLNGAMGIAVGMACDFPSHNLKEVAAAAELAIKNTHASNEDFFALIPGPDLPDGGQLTSAPADILQAYSTGRGGLRLRARWVREDLARGQWQMVVYELPYQVSAKKIAEEIEQLANPAPPAGKKTITPQQANLKQLTLNLIENVSDESSHESPVRMVITPRSKTINPDELMAFLVANTSLEVTLKVNLTGIGRDGKPQTKSLANLLHEWAAFRVQTVIRRTRFQLDRAERRIHVLEGRQLVYLNVDEVIATIREAEDPKAALMARFELSDSQAEDILEMRLRQLARLDGIKVEKELAEQRNLAAVLGKLLSDDGALRKDIVKEIRADALKYGDERRTLLLPEARAANGQQALPVLDEPVTLIVSSNLLARTRQGHDVDTGALTFKDGDSLLAVVKTRTVWPSYVLDSKGRVYTIRTSDIPGGRGDGQPLTSFFEMQEGAKVQAIFSGDPASGWVFAGSQGYGFILEKLESLSSRQKAGKTFLTLGEKERPLAPVPLPEGFARQAAAFAEYRAGQAAGPDLFESSAPLPPEGIDPLLAVATQEGRLAIYSLSDVKVLTGGKGVKLIGLDPKDCLRVLLPFDGKKLELPGVVRGKPSVVTLKAEDVARYTIGRGGKGAFLPNKVKF